MIISERIYLDYNATAPVRPDAIDASTSCLQSVGNSSSIHREGRSARAIKERCRRSLTGIVDARDAQLTFTSGATEANNWVIARSPGPVLVSAVEHPSVLDVRDDRVEIPVKSTGQVDLAALEILIENEQPALVAVMLANNETGILQPVRQIARICSRHGVALHVDAVQALGKVPFSFYELGCNSMALSAHKMGGPAGVGALVSMSPESPLPYMKGGGQEAGLRAGTENLAGVSGFEAALNGIDFEAMEHCRAWHERFEKQVTKAIATARIVGDDSPRLPQTTCLAIPGIDAQLMLMALDLAGIAVSSGAACSSGKVGPSHVLAAMGLGEDLTGSAIRISSGWATKPQDFDRLEDALVKIVKKITPDAVRIDCPLAESSNLPT